MRTLSIRVLLLLATAMGVLPTLAINQPAYALTFTERAVCTDLHDQVSPAVDGNRVVWQDERDAVPVYSPIVYRKNVRIRMKDLSTGSERFINANADGFTSLEPDISGSRVVWGSVLPGASGSSSWYFFVSSYNVLNSTGRVLSTVAQDGYDAAISGNRVVYCPMSDGDLYLYDFGTGTSKRVGTGDSGNSEPSISGTRIAYTWWNYNPATWAGHHDIWVYDLAAQKDIQICGNSADQGNPDISGTRIVWEDKRNGNYDIYMYDMATKVERRITSNAADQEDPSISGNRIVWTDYRNGKGDIYLYDLAANREQRVTYNSADQSQPDIAGNRIVWADSRNGNNDIYMAEIGAGLKTALTASVTPSSLTYGQKTTISATLVNSAGALIPGKTVAIEKCVSAGVWTRVTTASSSTGRYSVQVAPDRKTYYRVSFYGDAWCQGSRSAEKLVSVRAWMSGVTTAARVYKGRSITVSGYLRPKHAAGAAGVITLQAWQSVGGKWKLVKTVPTTVADSSIYSRYSVPVLLPYVGSWGIRAVHSDAGHLWTASSWAWVTVLPSP
jgi:beta propeller repeat protein